MAGLTSSPLFEMIIAVVVVWLIAATLTSGVVEMIGSLFAFRGKHLWRSLDLLLGRDSATRKVEGAGRKAKALAEKPPLDLGTPGSPTTLGHLAESIPGASTDGQGLERIKLVNPAILVDAILAAQEGGASDFDTTTVGKLVRKLPSEVADDADQLRARVEAWVDDAMYQMSNSYRSRLRTWTALVGLVVVLALGIDAPWLATRFYADSTARAAVIAVANSATAEGEGELSDDIVDCLTNAGSAETETESDDKCTQELLDTLDEFKVGRYRIGGDPLWPEGAKPDSWGWLSMLVGLGLSVGALAMGASFWFDVLKRLMGLRKARAT